jgi:PPP family 3-phenylpropionic acid transporter
MLPAEAQGEIAFQQRLALGALMFLTTGAWGFIQPLMTLLLEASGLGKVEIGVVLGLGSGAALFIQPLLGRCIDRASSLKQLILLASWGAATAYFLFPLVRGTLAFTALAAIGVNSWLFLNTAGAVMAGRLASVGQGATLYARYRVWGSIGYIVVALGSGLLLGNQELDYATLSQAFRWGPLLFVAIGFCVPFLPAIRPEKTNVLPTAPASLRAFFVACFLYFFAFNGMLSPLSLYLKALGATPLWITGTWAVGVTTEALMMTQIGRWSDRKGRRPALLLTFGALPLRCLLLIPATTPLWVMGVQASEAFCYGIIGIIGVAYLNDRAPENQRGAAQAKLAGVIGLALCFSPLVAGFIAEQWSIRAVFALMALIAALGTLVAWRFVPESRMA